MSDYEEADNNVEMSGQTPQSPDFKVPDGNFMDPKPKCLFGIPMEDQMQDDEELQKQ